MVGDTRPDTSTESSAPPYWRNLEKIGLDDVVISSIGVSGQSIVTNTLIELGLNLIDALTEELRDDGSAQPIDATRSLRRHFAGLAKVDASGQPRNRTRPRFIRTHAFAGELSAARPHGVWLVVRDPRDALYSTFRLVTAGDHGGIDSHYRDFGEWLIEVSRNDQMPAGSYANWLRNPIASWTEFHRGWLDRFGTGQRFAISRFEDLKARPVEELRAALRVFGVDAGHAALEGASERSSFEAMRAHEDAMRAEAAAGQPTAQIMRRGKAGEWQEWMTPRLAELFAGNDVRHVAGRLGYSL